MFSYLEFIYILAVAKMDKNIFLTFFSNGNLRHKTTPHTFNGFGLLRVAP